MLITNQFIFLFFIAIILTIATMIADAPASIKMLGEQLAKYLRILLAALLVLTIIGMGVINFQVTLTILMFGTGIIVLIDKLFFHKKRVIQQRARPFIVENSYAFFGVLLLVWIIRSFLIQPYRVPTGSLQPTVEPGDFLVVNQFAYGLHFPIGNKKFFSVDEPKRGDVALFYYPVDPNMVFVKRVIGLPGDHIEFRNKVLYINQKEMVQTDLGNAVDDEPAALGGIEQHNFVQLKEENLAGIKHKIYMLNGNTALGRDFKISVPAGHYFMMGDNRDNSDDSRVWGFVPKQNLIGKAFGIWMSWDSLTNKPRWKRIGLSVK